jgi:hypothetical protein
LFFVLPEEVAVKTATSDDEFGAAAAASAKARGTKLSRSRPVRGNLVHSMTFTAKDVDPSSRFLTGRETISRNEAKRREAVWDLFQSETAFLQDHLMVLKHVCINY